MAGILSDPSAQPTGGALAAGKQALRNTVYRSAGEGFGRLASLLLFADAGRTLGERGLGAFVFAGAFLGFLTVPVDLGLDRYLLRLAARDRPAGARHFSNIIALKLAIAVPLWGLGLLALHLLGYNLQVQHTVWALVPGVFSDSVARTQLAVFQAHERGGPPALADGLQRTVSAALGIVALALGLGVVSVAAAYSVGSIFGVVLGFAQMARTVGSPSLGVRLRAWRGLAASSLPFGVQDVFTVILARVDTLMLSLIASQAAVGRYGAAYRLFESSLMITYALVGAFSAMYTYLDSNSDPPLRAVFQRSIKWSLLSLTPLAVAFAVLGRPICQLVYGPGFASAGVPLAILGPGVVLISIVTLSTSLMVSREDPRRMVSLTALMAATNVVLNLLLIPRYGDGGAAAAMVATLALYVVVIMRMASRAAGGFQWLPTATGAGAAGAGMAVVALLLHASLWAALGAGLATYCVLLVSVEWLVSPLEVQVAAGVLRRRLSWRRRG